MDVDGFIAFPHKQVWNTKILLKVSFLIWTLCHQGAPTLDKLHRPGLVNSDQCILCDDVQETQSHLFLHCDETRKVWKCFLDSFGVSWVFSESIKAKIWELTNKKSNNMVKKIRGILPFATWWT